MSNRGSYQFNSTHKHSPIKLDNSSLLHSVYIVLRCRWFVNYFVALGTQEYPTELKAIVPPWLEQASY